MSSPQSVLYNLDSRVREILKILEGECKDEMTVGGLTQFMESSDEIIEALTKRLENMENILNLIVKLLGEKKK